MSTNPRISDDQLRALVRAAVARHLGHGAPASFDASAGPGGQFGTSDGLTVTVNVSTHPSHVRYALSSGSPDELRDGPCLIEPTVRCNHCGYCQSHGH